MPLPNFLIIGAGRAGTTSLYEYLKQHPEIYMSPVKEPKFFALEGQVPRYPWEKTVTRLEDYESLFRGANGQRALGEASPLYLVNPTAPVRIKHYIPNVKLIAILRDPAERAYSELLFHVQRGGESFRSSRVFRNDYIKYGFYFEQLTRYYHHFRPEQIRVYLFEDLLHNPLGLLKNIFQFLGVDDSFTPDISEIHNASRGVARNTFQWLVQYLAPKKVRTPDRPPLPRSLRRKLVRTYREDILKLQPLIQRDLSTWLQ